MKIKFTFIKTIVLLFLCKYNTDYAELNLFIWNMWQQKYNSYNYVKINVVFNPNRRGLWHDFWARPACTPVLSDLDPYTIGCSDSYFDIDTDMSSGTLIRLNKICPTKHNNCAVKQLHVFVNLIFLSKTCTNIYLSNPVLP